MTKDRVILGIDPGTIVMGYGVLTIEGNKPKLEAMGILQLNKYEDQRIRAKSVETKKDACNYRHPLLIDTLLYVC